MVYAEYVKTTFVVSDAIAYTYCTLESKVEPGSSLVQHQAWTPVLHNRWRIAIYQRLQSLLLFVPDVLGSPHGSICEVCWNDVRRF